MAFGKPCRRFVDEDQRILPLINVVFLLLIFFMVAGQLSKTDPITIDPPKSDSDTEIAERVTQVLISADGRVVVDDADVTESAIAGAIRAGIERSKLTEVHIKADGAADAAEVIRIMQQVKDGGATAIKLLTTQREKP